MVGVAYMFRFTLPRSSSTALNPAANLSTRLLPQWCKKMIGPLLDPASLRPTVPSKADVGQTSFI